MRRAGSGCSSTRMRMAGRTSSLTPRSRRSFKKPGTQVGRRSRSSPPSSTASSSRRAGRRRRGGSTRKLSYAACRAGSARARRRECTSASRYESPSGSSRRIRRHECASASRCAFCEQTTMRGYDAPRNREQMPARASPPAPHHEGANVRHYFRPVSPTSPPGSADRDMRSQVGVPSLPLTHASTAELLPSDGTAHERIRRRDVHAATAPDEFCKLISDPPDLGAVHLELVPVGVSAFPQLEDEDEALQA